MLTVAVFFFEAEVGLRELSGTGVQSCAIKVLPALALSRLMPSPVVRVRLTPPTVSVVLALMLTWPAVAELNMKLQLPPVVVQLPLAGSALAPLLLVAVKLPLGPSGALTWPPPLPQSILTVAVFCFVLLISLVALSGES